MQLIIKYLIIYNFTLKIKTVSFNYLIFYKILIYLKYKYNLFLKNIKKHF